MRRTTLVAICCLLLLGLTLPGCTGEVGREFTLTVSSAVGGGVTEPGQGTFPCDSGAVVDLVAEAQAGYLFVNWTGDVDTVADVNAVSTSITMNDDCEILANSEVIPPVQYDLMTSSTAGGLIISPGQGTYTYDEGAVIDLVAEAEAGYQFVAWTGDVDTVENVDATQTKIAMKDSSWISATFERIPVPMVAGGAWLTLGLKSDGTVVAVGYNGYGQCNVGNWTNIVQIAAGMVHTIGFKSDASVVATGANGSGQCSVSDWTLT